MKKIITIIIAILITAITFAQQWQTSTIEADPMRGEVQGTLFNFHGQGGDDIISAANSAAEIPILMFVSNNGVFDYDREYHGSSGYNVINASVGYYNLKHEFQERMSVKCLVGNRGNTASPLDTPASDWLMMQMKECTGYIRVIIPRYSGADLDMTFPTFKTAGLIK